MTRTQTRTYEQGAVTGSTIGLAVVIIVAAIFGSLAIWAYMNYTEQKRDVDGKIKLAVIEAKKDQNDQDDAKFAQREKEPNRIFTGPDDYGRLTFNYPKTWSVYVANDASKNGAYEAYLNPIKVPTVASDQQFALRVNIVQDSYEDVIKSYESLVQKGDLKSSATSSNGKSGTRLDGAFTKNIRGAIVIYKIRDRAITLQTDADTFKPDFEAIIKTIDFNS